MVTWLRGYVVTWLRGYVVAHVQAAIRHLFSEAAATVIEAAHSGGQVQKGTGLENQDAIRQLK